MRTTRPVPIARNLQQQRELAAEAVQVIDGGADILYVMPDGRFLVMVNAQPAGSHLLHHQAVLPYTREHAEDNFGWRSA